MCLHVPEQVFILFNACDLLLPDSQIAQMYLIGSNAKGFALFCHLFYLHTCACMCLCMGVHVPWCTCSQQRIPVGDCSLLPSDGL